MEDIGQFIFFAAMILLAIIQQVASKANKKKREPVVTKSEKGGVWDSFEETAKKNSTAPKATYESHVFGKYEAKRDLRVIDLEPVAPDAYYNQQAEAFNPSSAQYSVTIPSENDDEINGSRIAKSGQEQGGNRSEVLKNFSIRDAVIYSEILKTKF